MPHRILLWLIRAWPVLAVAFLSAIHFAILARFTGHSVVINKIAGTFMQIAGGLVVLHSVNDNLGLFRSQSLVSIVNEWLKSFPLRRRTTIVGVDMAIETGFDTMLGIGSVVRAANSIDERVAIIEKAIAELRTGMEKQKAELTAALDRTKVDRQQSISANQSAVDSLASKIEKATVGGFKQQAFGVLLAIYGALVSVFA